MGIDYFREKQTGMVLSSWQIIIDRYRRWEKGLTSVRGQQDSTGCMVSGISLDAGREEGDGCICQFCLGVYGYEKRTPGSASSGRM